MTAGMVYYVTYSYAVDSDQFDPKVFVDDEDIINTYGEETADIATQDFGPSGSTVSGVVCGNLTVAGRLALENGAPKVYLCQVDSGSTFNAARYKDSLEKLEKLINVGKVIAVFPSGAVSQSDIDTVHAYLKSHCERMSTAETKRERECIIGDAYTDFATSGGHNTIGDISTDPSFIYKAQSYNSKRVMYVAPTRFQRVNDQGTTMTLDGNYLACAVAGKILAQDPVSTPVTGMTIVGGTIPNELWSEAELNSLGAAGVTVITSRSNLMTIRHAITTNTASAETVEDSVVQIENKVKRTIRDRLRDMFIGKGIVIDDNTIYSVNAAVRSILDELVLSNVIYEYGTENNPLTGETPITAKQSTTEPRRIDVTFSYKPLYPLVWIKVTASTYV